jgi:signal transduction histidine kinase
VILRNVTEQREMARRMAAYERGPPRATCCWASPTRCATRGGRGGAGELPRLDAAGDHDATMLVDIIREQVDRLRTLMRDLLDVARPSPRRSGAASRWSRSAASVVDAWRRNPHAVPRMVTLQAPTATSCRC